MARKKNLNLVDINQKRIVEVAKKLFYKYGITDTNMDEVAKEADMSKSTLYVYFKSKDDIVNYISLDAMNFLYENFVRIIADKGDVYKVFMEICNFLVLFKGDYPISFQLIVEDICIDEKVMKEKPYLKEIYDVGEKINQLLNAYFTDVLKNKNKTEIKSITFSLWGSIYGVIELANNKEQYIQKSMGKTKEQFLQESFSVLYKLIERGGMGQ